MHTGAVGGTGVYMTTDSDLAVDVDLLARDPELTQTLKDANFTPVPHMPGQWIGRLGIRVDLMAVPHQSTPPHGRRAAKLPHHGKELARLTPGLEPALIDNRVMTITALDGVDTRTMDLRVAGPAALLTAKLVKLHERWVAFEAGTGKPTRLKEKDVLDCYRLLVAVETDDLVTGFESHRTSEEAFVATRTGLAFFDQQRRRDEAGLLHTMLSQALPGDLTALAAFDALSGDLIDGLANEFVTTD